MGLKISPRYLCIQVAINETHMFIIDRLCLPITWPIHFSKVPDANKGEYLPTVVSDDNKLQLGQEPRWGQWVRRWDSLRHSLAVCAEINWICKPTVASAVQVACLWHSCRWRGWVWSSWADLITHGLLCNQHWRWLTVIKWTFSSLVTALGDILAVSMPFASWQRRCAH